MFEVGRNNTYIISKYLYMITRAISVSPAEPHDHKVSVLSYLGLHSHKPNKPQQSAVKYMSLCPPPASALPGASSLHRPPPSCPPPTPASISPAPAATSPLSPPQPPAEELGPTSKNLLKALIPTLTLPRMMTLPPLTRATPVPHFPFSPWNTSSTAKTVTKSAARGVSLKKSSAISAHLAYLKYHLAQSRQKGIAAQEIAFNVQYASLVSVS